MVVHRPGDFEQFPSILVGVQTSPVEATAAMAAGKIT
jgi:hypothetical protein